MLDGIVAGLVSGAVYAILAVCIVMLHRLTGVLNLGQAAVGALGAYASYGLTGAGMPVAPAVLAGLVVAGSTAGLVGWALTTWLATPTATMRTVMSVVVLIVALTAGFRLFGDSPRVMPGLLPDSSFVVAGVRVSLTTVVALALAVALAAALELLLRHTRLGVRLEAISERPMTAQLLGVNTRAYATGAWAMTGALSALAMLLIAPTRSPSFETMSFLVVPALAGALLGGFSRVWVAMIGGLVIGAIEGAGARIDGLADYRGAVPFAIVIAALLWLRRREVWDAAR